MELFERVAVFYFSEHESKLRVRESVIPRIGSLVQLFMQRSSSYAFGIHSASDCVEQSVLNDFIVHEYCSLYGKW